MTVFMSSDLHLGHANIQSYCPARQALWHGDVDAMNEGLIERWNETVTDADTVWVLGDVAMGKIADSLPLVQALRGRKILVPGNHDRCWRGLGRKAKPVSMYLDAGFELVHDGGWEDYGVPFYIKDTPVRLSHFPYEGDSQDEDRYQEYRPTNRGEWLLHGHVHDAWQVNGRQINVGVDVWNFAPVSEEEIIAIIEASLV